LMISSWVMGMQHEPLPSFAARTCTSQLFTIVTYQEPTKEQQQNLRQKVVECASIVASQRQQQFFVVTDRGSVPYLREFFGDRVTLAY